MNFIENLENYAKYEEGATKALVESSISAYAAIFEAEDGEGSDENEDAELAELSQLGEELGDDLGASDETADTGDGTADTGDETAESGVEMQEPPTEQPAQPAANSPEQAPETVNAQPKPASISADALIKELVSAGFPEKIKVAAQQMKQNTTGTQPTAADMAKPVGAAVSKYMGKKGYAAMGKEDAIKVVKTLIMMATVQKKKPAEETSAAPTPQE